MVKQNGLGRAERLKSRKLIDSLFASPSSLVVPPFRAKYRFETAAEGKPGLQMGVTVGKARFKKAVDRNRVKRLVREAWRLQKAALLQQLQAHGIRGSVFFIYTAKEILPFTLISEAMKKCMAQLHKKSNHETAA